MSPFAERAPVEWKHVPLLRTKKITNAYRHSRSEHPLNGNMFSYCEKHFNKTYPHSRSQQPLNKHMFSYSGEKKRHTAVQSLSKCKVFLVRLKMWHDLARFCQKSAARRLHRRTFLTLSSITSFLITYYLPQQPLPLGISRRSDGTPAVTRFSFCGPVRVYCRRQLRSPAGPPFATRRRIFLIFELLFANRKFHRKSDTTKGYPKSQKISQASIFHLFWNHFGSLLVSLSMLFRKSRKSWKSNKNQCLFNDFAFLKGRFSRSFLNIFSCFFWHPFWHIIFLIFSKFDAKRDAFGTPLGANCDQRGTQNRPHVERAPEAPQDHS